MAEAILTIRNPSGLHARPAATFVRAATGYAAEVRVTNLSSDPDRSASGKSLLAVLGLGCGRGSRVRLEATGEDAEAAVRALADLIEAGLGEVSGSVETE